MFISGFWQVKKENPSYLWPGINHFLYICKKKAKFFLLFLDTFAQ